MRPDVDVAVIGGGLAGSALAAVLSARGIGAALVDLHEVYPPDFRAEKLTGAQIDLLSGLGLWRHVMPFATKIETLSVARFGRVVEHRPNREVGIEYADLVNSIRRTLDPSARIKARVRGLDASRDVQTLHLSDGRSLVARLAVVATGLGHSLRDGLGIRRAVIQDEHCLAIGFDLRTGRADATHRALTYYGERPADRSAYLTLFPIGDRLRANLFVYRRRDEAWTRAFRERPDETLRDIMPGLARLIGAFTVIGRPVVRPIDLYASEGHVRDGVVLIGDAFATTCPTGGTGIDKVLTDVDRLCALLPGWLATPGMDAGKIARFYADPAKVACDSNARRMIDYARGIAIETGLLWAARRLRNFCAQRLRHGLRAALAGVHVPARARRPLQRL